MGERTLSSPPPPPCSSPPTQPNAKPDSTKSPPAMSPPPPPPPPPPAPSSTPSAPPTKIRPRKSRKTSSLSSPSSYQLVPTTNTPSRAVRVLRQPLSADGELAAAISYLRSADAALSRVIDTFDPPMFHCLRSPFLSLVCSILNQQLAAKAANSIYSRFVSLCGGESNVNPESVLFLSPVQLRQIGVSGRKASYLHDLARKYHSGILSDESIVSMDDKSLFTMLTMVKGIGAWSVHMFMINSLHRPDVMPSVDLGFRKGVQMLYGLEEVPRSSQMEERCGHWRPYCSVGVWYMWRLSESRVTSTLAMPSVPAIAAAGFSDHANPPMIDPMQMLPNISS